MTQRKRSPSNVPPKPPVSPGINCEALASNPDRTGAHLTCGCGGKISCISVTALSETFACEQCSDRVVLLATDPEAISSYGSDVSGETSEQGPSEQLGETSD